jgi:hypothetical protein
MAKNQTVKTSLTLEERINVIKESEVAKRFSQKISCEQNSSKTRHYK